MNISVRERGRKVEREENYTHKTFIIFTHKIYKRHRMANIMYTANEKRK